MKPGGWQQLRLHVDAQQHPQLVELLESAGAGALTTLPLGDAAVLEPAPGQTPLWPRVQLAALFRADQDLTALVALLKTAGVPVTQARLADRDWLRPGNRWRAARFGQRLWVCPTGTGPELSHQDAVVVRLDPGLAFGTGGHATTRLCLEWLDAHPPRHRTVVDYGCGSGILALAAAKLGARHVRAVDIDPQALAATRRNASRNGLADRIALTADGIAGRCDLLLANILLGPLISLRERFIHGVRPGGDLVVSGLLEPQVPQVQKIYQSAFQLGPPIARDGWVLVHGVRLDR